DKSIVDRHSEFDFGNWGGIKYWFYEIIVRCHHRKGTSDSSLTPGLRRSATAIFEVSHQSVACIFLDGATVFFRNFYHFREKKIEPLEKKSLFIVGLGGSI